MRRYFYNIITQGAREPLGLIIKLFLVFLSFLYLVAVKLRRWLYILRIFKAVRLKSPVISVGNITWGGTGKTPLVETICLHFKTNGKRGVLLTRGYGMDEDKALTENLPDIPVLAGRDRVRNARLAEEKGLIDIFILDDGFQHWRIKREIDIVTIDAANPFGTKLLIPAGILREPLKHLSRADLVVITRSNFVPQERLNRLKDDILRLNPDIDIFESIHKPLSFYTAKGETRGLEYIKGKVICAISALGDNSSFIQTLEGLGTDIKLKFLCMDHHSYTKEQIDNILKECGQKQIDTIVTTQKDWVKLRGLLTAPPKIEFLILKIKLKIDDEEDFFRRLFSVLSG